MNNVSLKNVRSLEVILREGGFLTKDEVSIFAAILPSMLVCIRFGCSERKLVEASLVESAIEEAINTNPTDYVRDCFIPCSGKGESFWKALHSLDEACVKCFE